MEKQISLTPFQGGGLFTATLVFSVFTNLLKLTGPLFMLQIYDRVLASRSVETLLALLLLVAALFAFYGLLESARGRVVARIGARFQTGLNQHIFNGVLQQAALRRKSECGANALQDIAIVRDFYSSPVLLSLFDALWTPVFLFAIFLFHPMLGWLAITGGGIIILAAALNQLITRNKTLQAQQHSFTAAQLAKQVEDGAELIWSQGMGTAVRQRWLNQQNTALERAIGASDWTGSFTAFTKAFRFFLQSAMLALGAWLVLENSLTAGAMIAVSILLGSALAPIEQGLSQWPMVQRTKTSWRNLSQFLASLPPQNSTMALPEPKAELQVRNLSVVMRRDQKPVLQNVSFSLGPGKALGVIGNSGSGKTTLAKTLMGLIQPVSGEVRLAGALLNQYHPERRGKLIGYLPQNPQLYTGTIAENIAHMSLQPNADQVVNAAKKAGIHQVILNLPDGYDTMVQGPELQLSGGQLQRLALARALYLDPVILVLDEPNSALDAEGSEALNTVVTDMKAAQKAVVLMTHRPAAISACDNLLVLEGGRPAAYGPRNEIINSMVKNAGDVHRVVQGNFA